MQSSLRVVVSIVLLSSALATYSGSAKLRRDGVYSNKLRRDGVLNLYPFPRVGRASRNTWQVPLNDLLLEYEPVQKRQLYAFPRVGRSDLSQLRDQGLMQGHGVIESLPGGSAIGDVPGMWFGPRLGRSYKSNDDTISNDRSEPEQIGPMNNDRVKLEANF